MDSQLSELYNGNAKEKGPFSTEDLYRRAWERKEYRYQIASILGIVVDTKAPHKYRSTPPRKHYARDRNDA